MWPLFVWWPCPSHWAWRCVLGHCLWAMEQCMLQLVLFGQLVNTAYRISYMYMWLLARDSYMYPPYSVLLCKHVAVSYTQVWLNAPHIHAAHLHGCTTMHIKMCNMYIHVDLCMLLCKRVSLKFIDLVQYLLFSGPGLFHQPKPSLIQFLSHKMEKFKLMRKLGVLR